MILSFVHDIRGIRVIGGFTFGCRGAALGSLLCLFGFGKYPVQ
jgi:hypothetical protein